MGIQESLEEDNPLLRVLTFLITCFITGKKMVASFNLTVVIHEITGSKDMLRKCGICISYNYLLLLYTISSLRDAKTSKTCSRGIAYGKHPIVIVGTSVTCPKAVFSKIII